jgi:tagatose-1,6-bisphosphate aldolase
MQTIKKKKRENRKNMKVTNLRIFAYVENANTEDENLVVDIDKDCTNEDIFATVEILVDELREKGYRYKDIQEYLFSKNTQKDPKDN